MAAGCPDLLSGIWAGLNNIYAAGSGLVENLSETICNYSVLSDGTLIEENPRLIEGNGAFN